MADMLSLSVEKREANGSGPNRRLRLEGYVPGVYYDSKGENILVQVEQVPLAKLYEKVGKAHVFTLKVGTEEKPAFIWDMQYHATKELLTHVDFYGVDLQKTIRVSIPVVVTGKSAGVVLGGVLEVFRDKIEVECLPLSVPDSIILDITPLEIAQSIHISDVVLPEGVKAVFSADDNFAVLGINAPEAADEAGA